MYKDAVNVNVCSAAESWADGGSVLHRSFHPRGDSVKQGRKPSLLMRV